MSHISYHPCLKQSNIFVAAQRTPVVSVVCDAAVDASGYLEAGGVNGSVGMTPFDSTRRRAR